MKIIYLKEIIKARGLIIAGKKADMKLLLQQAVAAGAHIISEERTQQPQNQMEGLQPESHWEELNHMDEPIDYPDDIEDFISPTVNEGESEQIKYSYQEEFERPDFSGTCDVAIFTPRGHPMMRNGRLVTRTGIWLEGGTK